MILESSTQVNDMILRIPIIVLSATALGTLVCGGASAFTVPQPQLTTRILSSASTTSLFIDKKWFNGDDEEGESEFVTREMFLREQLEDPVVKRKRKGKGGGGGGNGYKPLDNRDHLPFAVKQLTPDPYTKLDVKKANQKRVKSKKTDLDHVLTNSRLYAKTDSDDSSTLLGEFQLDKLTTSGDIIQIGDREYRVESARCQYKYAGGQRFVMVRKILEVKEVARALKEELLLKQFQGTIEGGGSNTTSVLE